MKNAVKVISSYNGTLKTHFKLDAPMVSYEGDEISDIVVSSVANEYANETYIFPATEDGEIADFGELDGSTKGIVDHVELIESLGYTVS